MAYLGDYEGQTEKVLQFQDLTGIEDTAVCRDVLQRHQWNLEVAVQEQLNIREGRPSVYASEARPPALMTDHTAQHVYYSPPADGSASGFRGFVRNIIRLFVSFCYNSLFSIINTAVRLFGNDRPPITNPLQDVMNFIQTYDEKYTPSHPVFYQGTYSQVMNDAKRELKFLLIYLHNEESEDTVKFCRTTLADPQVINYINQNCFFWGCSVKSGDGYKLMQLFRPMYYPYMLVVVLKEARMTIVGRMVGFCDADTFQNRLSKVIREYEVNLVSARADRVEQSMNRSLRASQDEAFLESLKADQEKERRKEEERMAEEQQIKEIERERLEEIERKERIAKEKVESVSKVPDEPTDDNPNSVLVVIKLPCGTRLCRRFLKTHSLEAIFYFVFSHPSAPDSFEITTNFPKRVLRCKSENNVVLTIEQAGLKNREVLFVNDLDA
ncbi:PREDICTED: FAS-associated factor 2 [Nicrophorus vespilloides]|uniref:FAS-associated factor 2 n=1 Tax=Nicrophorus vespilloides TaxID=110193 RepID=A0ABM1N427_NICVS|nr:PREDICTED: FAS-associated factor 2 [Nicrophorus vespilloides]